MPLSGPLGRAPLPGTGLAGPDARRAALARYAPLPLRLFLGVTFLYAGIDKFADARPFSAQMNGDAMERLLTFSRADSAVPALNDLYLDHADWLGTGVGVAETAVGACLLLGLATRAAAAAGALLALVFWLTVSFGTDPYYFGADLPLLAAAVALALTGPGPLAADGVIAARRRRWRRHLYG